MTDMVIVLLLAIAVLPVVVAGWRRHSYVAVILIGCLVSAGTLLVDPAIGAGIWVGMMVWAAWPRRVGFVAPLVNATSNAVGRELGEHVREYREEAQTVADRLLVLHDLRQRGVLTEVEYEDRRAHLVGLLVKY